MGLCIGFSFDKIIILIFHKSPHKFNLADAGTIFHKSLHKFNLADAGKIFHNNPHQFNLADAGTLEQLELAEAHLLT